VAAAAEGVVGGEVVTGTVAAVLGGVDGVVTGAVVAGAVFAGAVFAGAVVAGTVAAGGVVEPGAPGVVVADGGGVVAGVVVVDVGAVVVPPAR
jgi:hypothetical protein